MNIKIIGKTWIQSVAINNIDDGTEKKENKRIKFSINF